MANNKVQAQEIESLNIREAFFMKNKKAIIIAVVAIVVIIAGVFGFIRIGQSQSEISAVFRFFIF